MATIVTLETGATAKGSPLTNAEVDNNFINLNNGKLEVSNPTFQYDLTNTSGHYVKGVSRALSITASVANWVNLVSMVSPGTYTIGYTYLSGNSESNGTIVVRASYYHSDSTVVVHSHTYNDLIQEVQLTSTAVGQICSLFVKMTPDMAATFTWWIESSNKAVTPISTVSQTAPVSPVFTYVVPQINRLRATNAVVSGERFLAVANDPTGRTVVSDITGVTTGRVQSKFVNTGGDLISGLEGSTAGQSVSGSAAYSAFIGTFTNNPFYLIANGQIRATVSAGGNIGLGVAPSAWGSNTKAIDISNGGGSIFGAVGNGTTGIGFNFYNNNTNDIYRFSTVAAKFQVNNAGQFTWHTAASGTAGNAISFTQAMTLTAGGELLINRPGASGLGKLNVDGGADFTNGNVHIGRDTGNLSVGGTNGSGYKLYAEKGVSGVWAPNSTTPIANLHNTAQEAGSSSLLMFSSFFSDATFTGVKVGSVASSAYSADFIVANRNVGTFQENLRLTANGYLGVGVKPSPWTYGGKGIDFGNYGFLSSGNSEFSVMSNVYYNDANWIYKTSGAASYFGLTAGGFTWLTATSGTVGAEVSWAQMMSMDVSGNLGVGGAPQPPVRASLWGRGTTSSTYSLVAYNINGIPMLAVQDDGRVSLGNGAMTLTAAGKLGVGTGTPYENFQVNGTIGSICAAGYNGLVVGEYGADAGTFAIQAVSGRSLRIVDSYAGVERIRITSTGDVGIGTNAPLASLSLGTGSADEVTKTLHFGYTPVDGYGYRIAATNSASHASAGNFKIQRGVVNSWVDVAHFDNAGNMGLGTTTGPWSAGVWRGLEVGDYGALANATGNFRVAYNSVFAAGVDVYKNTGAASFYQQAGGGHAWCSAPSGTAGNAISFTQAMTLDASGKLTNNASSHNVASFNGTGGAGGYVTFESGAAVYGELGTANQIISGGSVSDFAINARGSRNLIFGTNAVERARIDTSGNLGLGVTPSVSTLPSFDSIYGIFSGAEINLVQNAYYAGGWNYKGSADPASRYYMDGGTHTWSTAAAGTANNPISFTTVMGLNAFGTLTITSLTPQASVLNHSGGAYSTWQVNGTSIGDVGAGNQVISGGSSADFAISSRSGKFIFGVNGAANMTLDTSGDFTTANGRINLITVGRGGGDGANNTASGLQALYSNTTGNYNTASGGYALYYNTTGYNNSASGGYALYYNTTGYNNSASGLQALYYNTTGYNNSASGLQALYYNTTGNNNTASGLSSGFNPDSDIAQYRITTDFDMTLVGYGATKDNVGQLWNSTAIGARAKVTKSNQVVLGDSNVTETLINGNLGIGTVGNTYYNQVTSYKAGAVANYIQVANGTTGLAATNGLRVGVNASGVGEVLMGASTALSIDTSGNVGIGTGTPGARITGDFSNATLASRLMFQSSTIDGPTSVGLIPNGTSTISGLNLFSGTDVANTTFGQLVATGGEVRLSASANGTATASYPPMTFYTGGSERMRIDTSGNVGIGVANSGGYGGAKFATLDGMSMVNPGSKLHLYYIGATNRAWIGSETGGEITLGNGLAAPTERMRIDSIGTTTFVSAAFGYGAGAGGTVTQVTSKGQAVVMATAKPSGRITMHNASLAAGASIEFGFTNSMLAATDGIVVRPDGFTGYAVEVAYFNSATEVVLRVTNKGATRSDALVIIFQLVKGSIT